MIDPNEPTCRGSYMLGTACGRCPRCAEERTSFSRAPKQVTITRADLARACDEADKDMHRVGVVGTFFERVCKHLGLEG